MLPKCDLLPSLLFKSVFEVVNEGLNKAETLGLPYNKLQVSIAGSFSLLTTNEAPSPAGYHTVQKGGIVWVQTCVWSYRCCSFSLVAFLLLPADGR